MQILQSFWLSYAYTIQQVDYELEISLVYKSISPSKLYLNPLHRHFGNAGLNGTRAMNFATTESFNLKIPARHLNQ